MASAIKFSNVYSKLPSNFYSRLPPVPVKQPKLLKLNEELCDFLQIDYSQLNTEEGAQILAGNKIPPGAEPLAMVYAGHQFGGWVPQLGDGRAILLGEVTGKDGNSYSVHLKGSGRTPYSRDGDGDGRAPLGPVLREYLVSNAMAALGVPTTRSLAALSTGQTVVREFGELEGGVLVRTARSLVRVGTFEYFAEREDQESVKVLADHCIAQLYPKLKDEPQKYSRFLQKVTENTARTVASWMTLGFIHGVMNTDNTAVSGETIDYGPCAFMDTYDPAKVFSSIDVFGRYAFGNQPRIAQWNLAHLARALLSLIDEDIDEAKEQARAALIGYWPVFEAEYYSIMRRKVGFIQEQEGDKKLIDSFLDTMAHGNADFTLSFRYLGECKLNDDSGDGKLIHLFSAPEQIIQWLETWRLRLTSENSSNQERMELMNKVNPLYIPRNHWIEKALEKAYERDFGLFNELLEVVLDPFEQHNGKEKYAEPPHPDEEVTMTFCGT